MKLPARACMDNSPDFSIENTLGSRICGVDEVGRGPLAGPVIAACVYIPIAARQLDFINEIKDSKKISKTKLFKLYKAITEHCSFGIAEISVQEIDKINILQASLKAMRLAYEDMSTDMEHILIDGNKMPKSLPIPASTIVKGDSKSKSIAAASILAKVTRDKIMADLAAQHPEYGWESNAGYPSKAHKEAIDRYGITDHHRKSYAPIKNFLAHGSTKNPLISAA